MTDSDFFLLFFVRCLCSAGFRMSSRTVMCLLVALCVLALGNAMELSRMSAIFAEADKNGDGSLSMEEYVLWFHCWS